MDDAGAELVELIGWRRSGDSFQDWHSVEAELNTRLPADYKSLMEAVPSGTYLGIIGLDNPIESEPAWDGFHADFFDVLDRAKGWREHKPEIVPYALHPEPNGLIPWGRTEENGTFFWLFSGDDPDSWKVVYATADFEEWGEYDGSATAFLRDLISGALRTNLIPIDDDFAGPVFEATGVAYSGDHDTSMATQPDPGYWNRSLARELSHEDHDRSAELLDLLGVAEGDRGILWEEFEVDASVRLPDDYKNLLNSLGAGTLSGVRLFSPDAPVDDFDITRKWAVITDSANRARAEATQFRLPVHPDERGLVVWGAFVKDGYERWLAWAPVGGDPNRWPVVSVPVEFGGMSIFTKSMSELLLGYISGESGDVSMLRGVENQDGGSAIFVPAG
ncbi:SMI1/KNR4 family protein [Crossiella equi]|uniref:SMI1/KNR4 family protein n=1 Tax=Crossiella equi TaxID=130796 RepID=UPI000A39F452